MWVLIVNGATPVQTLLKALAERRAASLVSQRRSIEPMPDELPWRSVRVRSLANDVKEYDYLMDLHCATSVPTHRRDAGKCQTSSGAASHR